MQGPTSRRRGDGLPLPVFILLATLVIGGVIYGVMRWLQPPPLPPSVTLTFYDSRAQIRKANDSEWQPLDTGAHLVEGDSIKTGEGLRTTISLDDGNTLRIGSNSIVHLTRFKRADGRLSLDLTLETGRIWVDRAANATVHVVTDQGVVDVSGHHTEVAANSRQTVVRAWKGAAVFNPKQGKAVTVSEATEVVAPVHGELVSRAIAPNDVDAFEKWNRNAQTAQIVIGRITPQEVEHPRTLGMGMTPTPVPRPAAAPPPPRPAAPNLRRPDSAAAAPTPTRPAAPASAPSPTRVASARDPMAARAATVRSHYEPPSSLSRKGLPDFRTRVNKDIPSVDPYSQEAVSHAYELVSQQLSQHFNMQLSSPIKVTLVSPADFATLKTVSLGQGRSFRTEWLKVSSSAGRHDAYIISGLTSTMVWEACAQAYAAAWYDENAYKSKEREQAGFMVWIDYKNFEVMGCSTQAAIYLDPHAFPDENTASWRIGGQVIMSHDEIYGLQQMLTLEKQFGEFGVFYYITHGTPPD